MSAAGLRLLHIVRPLSDRRGDGSGTCSVCGSFGRFIANSWMLPRHATEEWGAEWIDAFVRRESLFCHHCSSSLRIRRLATVLLEHYGRRAASAADLIQDPGFRELELAEINAVGSLHRFLTQLPRLSYSEYSSGGEDIQELSYADESFDLVLSSDTLEHVPDWQRALVQTRRILRPGGRHLFTVPLVPTRARTMDVREKGWYHARGTGPYALQARRNDYRVYTVFGLDLLDALRRTQFEPELHFDDAATVICARAV